MSPLAELQEIIAKITQHKGHDFDKSLEHFALNVLAKSDTLQEAYGISQRKMEELYAWGFAYYAKNKIEDAALIFRWLVVLNPFDLRFWKGYSASCQLLGKFDKALKGYATAALLEDEDPTLHFHAHECYEALGEREEAKKALAMAYKRAKEKSMRKKIEASSIFEDAIKAYG